MKKGQYKQQPLPLKFAGEGARGGCFFEIEKHETKENFAQLDVGWSCVIVHRKEIPITWLCELVAIASGHKGGVAGFLAEQQYGGDSYALMCDPPEGEKK